MSYVNYDLIETSTGDIFLYLSQKYYWLSKPDKESRALESIPVQFGPHQKFSSLRSIILNLTREGTSPAALTLKPTSLYEYLTYPAESEA